MHLMASTSLTDALNADDIEDPFQAVDATGRRARLTYRPAAAGYYLYSLGENRADDGGVEYRFGSYGGDIVWRGGLPRERENSRLWRRGS